MASDERNALEELVEELERFSAENKGLFARRNHLILHKASRIIAELAKVKPVYNVYTNEPCWPTAGQAYDALITCRAIAAEEGANKC